MDKVKKFLERYVEWLALALGAVFLGWNIWGFVLNKPIKVPVGDNTEVEPGDVAEKVWDGPGKQVDTEIKRTDAPPTMTPQVDYPSVIASRFSEVPPEVKTVYASNWIPQQRVIDDSLETLKAPDPGDKQKVAQLPVVPAPFDLEFSHGHSNIQLPQVGQNQATLTAQLSDKNWITFQGKIPVKALADAIDAAKIPDKFNSVAIYRVEAFRQEKNAAGGWGSDIKKIDPLPMNELKELPKNDCDYQLRQEYKSWAEDPSHVVLIAEPPFYNVVHGSIWYKPGAKDPNQVDSTTTLEPFDLRNALAYKGDPNLLLPDEKKIYDAAKLAQARKDAVRNRPQTPPTTPPGGSQGFGGNGGQGARHAIPTPGPSNAPNLLQPQRGARQNNGMPFYTPQGVPNNAMDNSGPADTNTLPQGSFTPKDRLAAAAAAGTDADIKIWVHDDAVQAGKTYRYKLRYILSNPVADTRNLCKVPAMEQQTYIFSEDSKWSEPINVESDTDFYAVDNDHGIRFDIFKWINGARQKQTVQANVGDRIGLMQTTNNVHTDFDTGWTLVDIRDDPAGNSKNKILVLVGDTGTVRTHEISADRSASQYRDLLREVQNTTTSR